VVRIDGVVCALVGMVETVRFHQVMWFVMLEFAKDRVLGVDTPGQQVPSCVRYRTACLLIRDASKKGSSLAQQCGERRRT
jgi:hypothetical protein